MLKQFLHKYFPNHYQFYNEKQIVAMGNSFQGVKTAAEKLIEIKQVADISKSFMVEVNKLTGLVLMEYHPAVASENKVEWKEQQSEAKFGFVHFVVMLVGWFAYLINLSIRIVVRLIDVALATVLFIVTICLNLLALPLLLVFGGGYILWLITIRRKETQEFLAGIESVT